ncbi:MAG: hypothetical protein KAI76_07300 [Alphaproteobacteria bacterium]|nr:hypothetical protein [Alphaproteobacteria bacterium]
MRVKTKLKGAFDLLFLFGDGIHAFSGSKRDVISSLVIPVMLFPITLSFNVFYPPKGMETNYPDNQILTTVSLHTIFSFVISLIMIFFLAKAFNKSDKIWLFLETINWVGAAFFLVTVPLALAAIFNWILREEIDRIFVITQCFFYLAIAHVILRVFQLNWQLSGFMAISVLFVDQTTWDVLFAVQGIPKPW